MRNIWGVIRIRTTRGTLARRGFVDARAAEDILQRWHLDGADDPEVLVELVARSADPDLALAGLDRLAEVAPGLGARLTAAPVLARQLIMVLGGSSKLAQHLIAHPGAPGPAGAGTDQELGRRPAPGHAGRRSRLTRTPRCRSPPSGPATACGSRTGVRCCGSPPATWAPPSPSSSWTTSPTSCPIWLMPRWRPRWPSLGPSWARMRLKTRLAVVGLGKCGAQELNYVSDVDVLFVAEPVLDDAGEPLISNEQAITVATRLAAEMTRICSAHTAAGTIWEVDAALRPEGKAGQLVRTLASHRIYYERWAKTWEFQAMLKARPCAGDLELGQQFVDLLAPMVWAAADRENFVPDAQAMRKRVVAHIPVRDAGPRTQAG